MRLVTVATIVLSVWQPAPPRALDIRSRVDAYERQAQNTGRQDLAALSDIGRAVIAQARRSPKFLVWSEACASTLVPDGENCASRLRAILNAPSESSARRAEAASALLARGDKTAADALARALKTASPATLAPIAPIIALMPPDRAVPLLIRLSESDAPGDQGAACRELGRFDRPEVRTALARNVSVNAPGTEPWLLCMIARARLREPDTVGAVGGYGHTLQGGGLLYAIEVMLDVGNEESALQILTDLTRRGSIRSRLAAASLLIDRKPDVAIPIVEAAEADPDPEVRAEALTAERRLKRPLSKLVRGMLADSEGIVQIRAADAVIDWAEREQNR